MIQKPLPGTAKIKRNSWSRGNGAYSMRGELKHEIALNKKRLNRTIWHRKKDALHGAATSVCAGRFTWWSLLKEKKGADDNPALTPVYPIFALKPKFIKQLLNQNVHNLLEICLVHILYHVCLLLVGSDGNMASSKTREGFKIWNGKLMNQSERRY